MQLHRTIQNNRIDLPRQAAMSAFTSGNGIMLCFFIDSEGLTMASTLETPADRHSLTLVRMAPGLA